MQEDLIEYEGEFDRLIALLPIWQLPVRPILTTLHIVVDGLFNGSRRNEGVVANPEAGNAAGARLSYLVPYLLKCESEPTGLNAADAIRAVNELDPDGTQRAVLLCYGHFCEIMPEVHRGYYVVEGSVAAGFRLTHTTQRFADHEAIDIILAELSLSFLEAPAPRFLEHFDRQAKAAPQCDLKLKFHLLKLLYEHYLANLNEPPILSEEGYLSAFGTTRKDFERFRACLFSYADYCKGMAAALVRRIRQEGFGDALWTELLEWLSVNWKETFFVGVLKGLTGLEFNAIDRLLELFAVDFRNGHKSGKHAGDGFFPPLARLEEAYLFSPDLLKFFLPARNVLYSLNRTDRKRYDDLVSHHLEPELIKLAADLFATFSGLRIASNYIWDEGEIDLLVYCETENVALQIQAKAAIPPQGARMVQAVETRMLEGIEQLRRFRSLRPEQRDEVISKAIGVHARDVEIVEMLLSRSCFGTDRVWSQLETIVPMNLTLLRGILRDARADSDRLSLQTFADRVHQALRRLTQSAHPRFVEREMLAGKTTIRLPLLEFDAAYLRKEQRRIWADSLFASEM